MGTSAAPVWQAVHAERRQLAADLADIDDAAWVTPSLFPGWDVHDVVAQLTQTPPGNLAARLVEAVVHGEDVRRPLGMTGSYPQAAVEQALAYPLKTPVSGRPVDIVDLDSREASP